MGKLMDNIGAGTQIAGAVTGIANGLMSNTRRQQQYGDQVKLMGIQQGNQMALNRQMQEIAMENWEKTNYDAQRKQMEKAGLNTALMYGGQGGGGMVAQSGTGGSAASGNAPTPEGFGAMGIGLQQSALAIQQIDSMKAKAELDRAEANRIKGENPRGQEEITNLVLTGQNLAQDVNNKQAQQKLTEMQTNLTGIQYDLANATIDENIKITQNEVKKGLKEIYILEQNGKIQHEEAINKAKEWRLKLTGLSLENGLTEAKTNLTKEQIKQVTQDVLNSIENTRSNTKNSNTNRQNADTNYQSMMDNYSTKIKEILIKQGILDNEELKTTISAITGILSAGMK